MLKDKSRRPQSLSSLALGTLALLISALARPAHATDQDSNALPPSRPPLALLALGTGGISYQFESKERINKALPAYRPRQNGLSLTLSPTVFTTLPIRLPLLVGLSAQLRFEDYVLDAALEKGILPKQHNTARSVELNLLPAVGYKVALLEKRIDLLLAGGVGYGYRWARSLTASQSEVQSRTMGLGTASAYFLFNLSPRAALICQPSVTWQFKLTQKAIGSAFDPETLTGQAVRAQLYVGLGVWL